MSAKKRRRRPKKIQAAPITQVLGVLGKTVQSGWIVSMRSFVDSILEACPKLSQRQIFLVYEELCKPPFEYLKKRWELWEYEGGDTLGDHEVIDFTEAQIQEARKTGELFDPYTGRQVNNWEERVQATYVATDKFPRDPGAVATDELVDAIHAFKNDGKPIAKVTRAWRKFCDLHGLESL